MFAQQFTMQPQTRFRAGFSKTTSAISAYGYQKPKKFLGALFSKNTFRKIAVQLYDPSQSDERKAMSAALGVFIGLTPIWGFQTIIAISLAVLFKLNKALVVLFSHVSFPPLLPFIVLLSYRIGGYWMSNSGDDLTFTSGFSFKNLNGHLEQYIYGSLTLAVTGGVTVGLLTFATFKLIKVFKRYRLSAAA